MFVALFSIHKSIGVCLKYEVLSRKVLDTVFDRELIQTGFHLKKVAH